MTWLEKLFRGINIRWMHSLTRNEAADLIERFLNGESRDNEWGSFLDEYFGSDVVIEQVRREIDGIQQHYPAEDGSKEFCSEEGLYRIKQLIPMLRKPT